MMEIKNAFCIAAESVYAHVSKENIHKIIKIIIIIEKT